MRNPFVKITLAFVIFFGLLTFGLLQISHNLKRVAASLKLPTHSNTLALAKPLFYSAIGDAPAATQEPVNLAPLDQYTLELGVAQDQNEAMTKILQLEKMGIRAFYTPLQNGGRVIYRIRKGIYGDLTKAQQDLAYLQKEKRVANAQVVKLH